MQEKMQPWDTLASEDWLLKSPDLHIFPTLQLFLCCLTQLLAMIKLFVSMKSCKAVLNFFTRQKLTMGPNGFIIIAGAVALNKMYYFEVHIEQSC